MPVYDFACDDCKKEWEGYVHSFDDPTPDCECGGASQKVWRPRWSRKNNDLYPYITKNIHPDGRPIEVESASHLNKLCKQYGVRHRPDVAWNEEEYTGYDWKTGKQTYHRGSGLGVKGCWI
jgi:putative FmdB family regulatory protein